MRATWVEGSLFNVPLEPVITHRFVPDTSRAALTAAVNAGRVSARGVMVLEALREWTARHQDAPTSAELARFVWPQFPGRDVTWMTLHVRRALNDLHTTGDVRKAADRDCTVTNTKANTWFEKKR